MTQTDLLSEAAILAQAVSLGRGEFCIYFLINEGSVVYVGKSTNFFTRLAVHHGTKEFTHFVWIPCPAADLDRLERAYIKSLSPVLNVLYREHQSDTLNVSKFPVTLRKEMKRLAVARNMTMSEWFIEASRNYLDQEAPA